MRTYPLHVWGKFFYRSNGETLATLTDAPAEGWTQKGVVPGRFTTLTEQDRTHALRLGADVVLIGCGETFRVYQV